jgi:hypothetical protein
LKRTFQSPLFTTFLTMFGVVAMIVGCNGLNPGADPLIVNTERALTVAPQTFDLVLGVEASNFAWFKTNLPDFYKFCEEIKKPVLYVSPEYGETNVQKCIAAQLELDDLKNAYSRSKLNSNALYSAQISLEFMIATANNWLVSVTNAAPNKPPQNP